MSELATSFKEWLNEREIDYFELNEDSHESVEFLLFFDSLDDGGNCLSAVSAYVDDPNIFSVFVRFPLSLETVPQADLCQLVDNMNRNFDVGTFYSVSAADSAGSFFVVEFRIDTIITGVSLSKDAFEYILECLSNATEVFIDMVTARYPEMGFTVIDFSAVGPSMQVIEGGRKSDTVPSGDRKRPSLSLVIGKKKAGPESSE